MNFRSNLDKNCLLSSAAIEVYFDNKKVSIVAPSVKMYLTDLDFQSFIYTVKLTPEKFREIVNSSDYVVNTEYEQLLAILKIKGLEHYRGLLIKYMGLIFPNLTYKNSAFFCGEQLLTSEEYKILIDMLLVSCGEKDIKIFAGLEEVLPEKPLSASEKRMKEVEEKLRKVKEKKKQKTDKKTKESSVVTYDQIVIAIMYEFKSLTLEKIYDMNMFTLLELYGYISKVVDNQIQIVAAGNGNLKNFTYFI